MFTSAFSSWAMWTQTVLDSLGKVSSALCPSPACHSHVEGLWHQVQISIPSLPGASLTLWLDKPHPIHYEWQPAHCSQTGPLTWEAQVALRDVIAQQRRDSVVLSSSYKSAQATCCRDEPSSGLCLSQRGTGL